MRVVANRVAVATAAATFVLILAGGLVTNTGNALAVPDWPTTFGHNMFTFPWSAMVGGIFLEHTHRLLGALVGLLTLALAALLWPSGGMLRALGMSAVAAVIVQGVLGGLRVVLVEYRIAVVHGALAQAFFALVVVIAMLTSGAAGERTRGSALEPVLRTLTLAVAALVYVQIVLGAFLTHLGWLELHLGGAVLVATIVPMVTAHLRRTGDPVVRPLAIVLASLLVLQLALGAGAWLVRFTSMMPPGGPAVALAFPVAHRLAGGLMLAAAVMLAVRVVALTSGESRARRLSPARAAR
jgi:cytochrome c oxidase assembly protein subunit 15